FCNDYIWKMSKDSMDDLTRAMKTMGKLSLMDLPDDLLIKIFKYLDLPTRLKSRVNKRLDQIQMQVPTWIERMDIEIADGTFDGFENWITLDNSTEFVEDIDSLDFQFIDLDDLKNGLYRLNLSNVSVSSIQVLISDWGGDHRSLNYAIGLIFDLEPDKLRIVQHEALLSCPLVGLPPPSSIMHDVRDLAVDYNHLTLTVQHLLTIRQTMVEGKLEYFSLTVNCKLECFSVTVSRELRESFLRECFGVLIERQSTEGGAHYTIYKSDNDSVELYYTKIDVDEQLEHFEGNIQTTVYIDASNVEDPIYIVEFEKLSELPVLDNEKRLKLDHPYLYAIYER
ncbi:hypothetical protein PMAYCL1PPCAC_23066, partial [Pristionchus mayeri]